MTHQVLRFQNELSDTVFCRIVCHFWTTKTYQRCVITPTGQADICWDQVYDESSVREIGFLRLSNLAEPIGASFPIESKGLEVLIYLFSFPCVSFFFFKILFLHAIGIGQRQRTTTFRTDVLRWSASRSTSSSRSSLRVNIVWRNRISMQQV